MIKTTNQYATVTIPANHPCERSHDRMPWRWPIPLTVRAHRTVVTNRSKGTFRATGNWIFIQGAYAYTFDPAGCRFTDERIAQRDFRAKEQG